MSPQKIANSPTQTCMRKMGMSQHGILEQLKQPKYEGFLDDFRQQSFAKGQLISLPGSANNEVFIVLTGRTRVYLAYEEREFTLCYLEEGDIFATHTRAFVEAAKDSSLLLVSAREFGQKVLQFPELSFLMTDILGEVLSSTLDIIDGLIFHDVRHRLIDFILAQANENGQQTDQGIQFHCDLSIEDISMLIGTSRQTASSLLNNLIRDGYVAREGRSRYTITQPEQLAALVE
ncbi:Crp/Fnr family transcriptional regulator [Reinekea marinisedimentorum]|uniref:CRP-like cAMP-binding protein n=1 Tax=Reinekea marinisedimentorum TaxID=230495 RepID=A0A4R3I712_9GAMM|nr:Crp/Fnr family transcriptional regulator [Reinekea marinisedimentorum]TCS41060.1 CRP-like cAMP-binding protein [Reinekea marinisedimentorum]